MKTNRYNYEIEGIIIGFLDEDGGGYYNLPLEELLKYTDKLTELELNGIKQLILKHEKEAWEE